MQLSDLHLQLEKGACIEATTNSEVSLYISHSLTWCQPYFSYIYTSYSIYSWQQWQVDEYRFLCSLLEHQSMLGLFNKVLDVTFVQQFSLNWLTEWIQPVYHYFVYVLSHAVAFMHFSQSAYSQDENNSSLSVRLVLEPFGGSGSGSAAITQDIVEQIIAFTQAGDTATGKRSIKSRLCTRTMKVFV